MGATGKSVRDGGITAGAGSVATAILLAMGVDAPLAAACGVIAGAVVARVYRMLRNRFSWLGAIDPAGGSQ